jgi:acyl carrier protein
MIDFIELVNKIARVAKPASSDFDGVKSMETTLKEAGLDSLDWLVVMIYLCEIYGIPEAIGKEFYPLTVQELYDLLMQHKTKEPSSIEEAIQAIS